MKIPSLSVSYKVGTGERERLVWHELETGARWYIMKE